MFMLFTVNINKKIFALRIICFDDEKPYKLSIGGKSNHLSGYGNSFFKLSVLVVKIGGRLVGGVEGLELGDGVVPLPDQLVLGPVEPRVDTHSLAVVNRLG